MFRCLEGCISILLLSCSLSSGALESPDLLQSCFIITVALHNTAILIITLTSVSTINQCRYTHSLAPLGQKESETRSYQWVAMAHSGGQSYVTLSQSPNNDHKNKVKGVREGEMKEEGKGEENVYLLGVYGKKSKSDDFDMFSFGDNKAHQVLGLISSQNLLQHRWETLRVLVPANLCGTGAGVSGANNAAYAWDLLFHVNATSASASAPLESSGTSTPPATGCAAARIGSRDDAFVEASLHYLPHLCRWAAVSSKSLGDIELCLSPASSLQVGV